MYFSSVNRSCFKLFLFSTVLLNITLLKMGFIVVQWENENSVSVLNEKKVVGAVDVTLEMDLLEPFQADVTSRDIANWRTSFSPCGSYYITGDERG